MSSIVNIFWKKFDMPTVVWGTLKGGDDDFLGTSKNMIKEVQQP
jgi:hypothetical protein